MSFASKSFRLLRILCCLKLLLAGSTCGGDSGDFFTAVSQLKGLVDVEKQLTNYLKHFIAKEQRKIDRITTYYMKSQHVLSLNMSNETTMSKYIGDPINGFLILKRFIQFGSEVERLIDIDFTKGEPN